MNNFPEAYGTTSRKTMSADRSIEGDGKLNSNVYDFFPRHCSNISNINDISIDVLFFYSTTDVLFRGIQEVS